LTVCDTREIDTVYEIVAPETLINSQYTAGQAMLGSCYETE